MPESVVRGKLESLNFRVQGVMQLRSGGRDQDATKDRLFIVPLYNKNGIICGCVDASEMLLSHLRK